MVHVTTSINRSQQLAAPTRATSRSRPAAASKHVTAENSGACDFRALFSSQQPSNAAPSSSAGVSAQPASAPTPESVFGSSPWMANPVGNNPDGTQFGYNPWYFATPQAAAQVAQMLGGTVVASNEFTAAGSPFVQQQPNLMVKMPDGRTINAGLVASFYAHGYPQSYINALIAAQINGTNT
jgi:hypothetical protein